jgi:hypothetical protein
MSTLKTINVIHPSGSTNNIVLDSSGNMTAGGTMAMSSSFMRNRIINGAMVIDQRNAGAAVNGSGGTKTYPVDRFYSQIYNTTGNTTGQQSSVAPTGFTNSMRITVQTADASVGATDQVWYGQDIEGFNVSDFGFGAAGAATITLSFWVYSNVTGTYCVTFKNSAENRGYTAEYTISASNTWEKKTITLAGDTTGTWLTTNGAGLKVWFVLMAGSSQQTTANTWNATSGSIATSNQVNFMSSTSNSWQISGVQLEVGSVATPFERRQYGQELALCQRYYYRVSPGVNSVNCLGVGYADTTVAAQVKTIFPVTMRTAPTALEQSGTAANYALRIQGASAVTCSAVPSFSSASVTEADYTFTVASGLTAGGGVFGRTGPSSGTSAYLGWSAEL